MKWIDCFVKCRIQILVTVTYTLDSMNEKENINMTLDNSFPRGQWIPLVFELKFLKVVDVNIIVPGKVVEVTFADGTKEKSVCSEPDIFSLESAISICISKKIIGGSSSYNNAVKHGMKVYENKLKKKLLKRQNRNVLKRNMQRDLLIRSEELLKELQKNTREKQKNAKNKLKFKRKLI